MSRDSRNPDCESETRFQEAIELRDAGRHDEALALLKSIESALSSYAAYYLVLGNVQQSLDHFDEAHASYRRATTLAPTHELASLCLFHLLWSQGEQGNDAAREQALAEIGRYMTVADSEDYRNIIKELHEVIVQGIDPSEGDTVGE